MIPSSDSGGAQKAAAAVDTVQLDLSMIEKLKQKYIRCKQQNECLKKAFLQQRHLEQHQQHRDTQTSAPVERVEALEQQVEHLQQELKVRDIKLRQQLEELDTLQYTIKKQQQQLQQLLIRLQQRQQPNAASSGGGLAGSGWGIHLLSAASSGNSRADSEQRKLLEEIEVLRDELEHKIRENEQLHVHQFEERQNQHAQEELVERLQQQLHFTEQQRQQLQERLQQLQQEALKQQDRLKQECQATQQMQQIIINVRQQTRHHLLSMKEQLQLERKENKATQRYFQRRLSPVDLHAMQVLSVHDLPSGAAAVAGACVRAQQQVVAATASLLLRLRDLVTAWSRALQEETGSSTEGCCTLRTRSGLDASTKGDAESGVVAAAGLVAFWGKSSRLQDKAAKAAVVNIHSKLKMANSRALEALTEAQRTLSVLLKIVVDNYSASFVQDEGSGGIQPERKAAAAAADGNLAKGRTILQQLKVAVKRFITYTLVSLDLEHDAFPTVSGEDDASEEEAEARGREEMPLYSSYNSRSDNHFSSRAPPSRFCMKKTCCRSGTTFTQALRRLEKNLVFLLDLAEIVCGAWRSSSGGSCVFLQLPDCLFLSRSTASTFPFKKKKAYSVANSLQGSAASTKQSEADFEFDEQQPSEAQSEERCRYNTYSTVCTPSRTFLPQFETQTLRRLSSAHFRALAVYAAPHTGSADDEAVTVTPHVLPEHRSLKSLVISTESRPNASGLINHREVRDPVHAFTKNQGRQRIGSATAVAAAAAISSLASASSTCELTPRAPEHALMRVLFSRLHNILHCMTLLQSCISARICKPHIVEGYLLPLSGGGKAMVALAQALKLMDMHIPLPWTRIQSAHSQFVVPLCEYSREKLNTSTTASSVALLREGLQLYFCSELSCWIRLLQLPGFLTHISRLQLLMANQKSLLERAPPRLLRKEALAYRHSYKRLVAEARSLKQQLLSCQCDLDALTDERDRLRTTSEQLEEAFLMAQAQLEMASRCAQYQATTKIESERLMSASYRKCERIELSTESSIEAGPQNLATPLSIYSSQEDVDVLASVKRCAASVHALLERSLPTDEGEDTSHPAFEEKEAPEASTLPERTTETNSSNTLCKATLAGNALLRAIENQLCSVNTANFTESREFILEQQRQLRMMYTQEVRRLLRHVQTSENALSLVKIQLNSCVEMNHDLEQRRQELLRLLQNQRKTTEETACAAKLVEQKYVEHLSLLSENYCQEVEKVKRMEECMKGLKLQKILCGRCGIWNSLESLMDPSIEGTCTACCGRIVFSSE